MSQPNTVSFIWDTEREPSSPELTSIIAYPRCTSTQYRSRLNELKILGVTSLLVGGRTRLGKIGLLGKGCVGLVIKARIGDEICALKIRRTDASRASMHREARLLRLANASGVGPRLMRYSKNFVAMQYISGPTLREWTNGFESDIREKDLRPVVRSILEQCHILDRAGVDHGELSRLDHHVIVSEGPAAMIVDFESASIVRKTCNVTAAAQSIFLAGAISKRINEILGDINREKLIEKLRSYKRQQSRVNFDAALEVMLDPD